MINFRLSFFFSDTIHCWEKLLSWSERRQITTRFQAEIQSLKDVLEDLGSKAFDFSSEAHIQLAIDQLKVINYTRMHCTPFDKGQSGERKSLSRRRIAVWFLFVGVKVRRSKLAPIRGRYFRVLVADGEI